MEAWAIVYETGAIVFKDIPVVEYKDNPDCKIPYKVVHLLSENRIPPGGMESEPGELTQEELEKYKAVAEEKCTMPEVETTFTRREMSRVIAKLERALNERVVFFGSGAPQGDPTDVVREAWNLYVGYCSWEDLPPKMSAKVKEAAEMMRAGKIVLSFKTGPR